MYTLVRNFSWTEGLLVEAPCFVSALMLAEAYYKFHSFSLECLAFLATWFALSGFCSALRNAAVSMFAPSRSQPPTVP